MPILSETSAAHRSDRNFTSLASLIRPCGLIFLAVGALLKDHIMPRVLVTGINGFTGLHLAPRLRADGLSVHGVVHDEPEEPIEGVEQLHVADLSDLAALCALVEQVRPEFIVHLAAISFVAHEDVDTLYRTNIVGTRNLLQAAVRAGYAPDMILLASSANIYGDKRAGPLDEEIAPEPANDYGVSKLAMEYMARLYFDKLKITIVRPFNYTGMGQASNFIIPKIVQHARERRPRIELGNLDVERDFSDVRTVVDCYARLLQSGTAPGQIFNVCSGRAFSLRNVIAEVERLSGHHMEISVNPAFVRDNEVRSLYGTCRKLEAAIGETQMRPLSDTLKWMLDVQN